MAKFKPECSYFSLVLFMKGILLPMAVTVFSAPEGEVLWMVAVLLMYFTNLIGAKPYRRESAFHSDAGSTFMLLLILNCVGFFSDQENATSPAGHRLSIIVVFAGCAPCVIFLGALAHLMHEYVGDRIVHEQAEDLQIAPDIIGAAEMSRQKMSL